MFYDSEFMPFTPNERPSFRSIQRNFLEAYPPAAYREAFWSLRGLWPIMPKTVYLTDPALIEEMLLTRAEFFQRDVVTVRALAGAINKGSLFFAEGADWKWQRRALAPAFRHENLLALTPIFTRCAGELCQAWRRERPTAPIDAMKAMSEVTFSIIESAVLGGFR